MNFIRPLGAFEIVFTGSVTMFFADAIGLFAALVSAFLNSSVRETSFSRAIALISLIRVTQHFVAIRFKHAEVRIDGELIHAPK